ncbi:hypothetical protein D3C80_1710050 [compost metagenome]
MPAGQFDVADTGCFGLLNQGRTGICGNTVVLFQCRIGARDPSIDLRRQVVGGVGQCIVTTKHPIGPPPWHPFANGSMPDRVKCIGQMPEHAAATQPAAFEGRPVDAEPGIPLAGFIERDGLPVGFFTRAAQSQAA